jgi:CheY-like chemotaxis protein
MSDHEIILLVEDREDDILLIRRAFEKAHVPNPMFVVRNGEEAIAYLSGENGFCNRAEHPLPQMVLLDLHMPRVNGFEVIKWIRQQPGLATLLVIVLTSSDQLRDVHEAYRLGANSFLVKPLDFQNFVELGEIIRNYWINTNRAPEPVRPPARPNPKLS